MRLIVCGGRDFKDKAKMSRHLDNMLVRFRIDCIIEGEASGADSMARDWAEYNDIPVMKFPANWSKYGKAAGPIRNKEMINEGDPDYGLAFYDRPKEESRGTKNMVEQLKNAGIRCEEILVDDV
jgi:YspA, cpYpsA-related SLOG family